MSRKSLSVLVVILFFSCFNLARAEVIINEVQLSPTTGRFLEIYNTGDSSVDLTGWYIQRKTATGNSFGSLVSKPNFEGKTIVAHDYFVISRDSLSSSDIILDSLTLTESNTIQIKNQSGEITDKLGWGSSSDCGDVCPPNPSLGESIQKTPAGWLASAPTPGAFNQSAPVNNNKENTVTSNNEETPPPPAPTPVITSNDTASNGGSSADATYQKAEEPPVAVAQIVVEPTPVVVSSSNIKKEEEPAKSVESSLPELKERSVKVKVAKLSPVPFSNLTASVVSSDTVKNTSFRAYLLTTILTILIGVATGAVYFIRQKRIVAKTGDDFKILDE